MFTLMYFCSRFSLGWHSGSFLTFHICLNPTQTQADMWIGFSILVLNHVGFSQRIILCGFQATF